MQIRSLSDARAPHVASHADVASHSERHVWETSTGQGLAHCLLYSTFRRSFAADWILAKVGPRGRVGQAQIPSAGIKLRGALRGRGTPWALHYDVEMQG